MQIEELQSSATLALWHDGEESRITYALPFYRQPWRDLFASLAWADLSRRRGLLIGRPADYLRTLHGFWIDASPESHVAAFVNALDFLVPDGTTVLAAEEGRVIAVIDGNDRWGPSPEFANCMNYVRVQHRYGEWSEYIHLKKGSVTHRGLQVGTWVRRGQPIGTVGKTGWTDRDHLHFGVFRTDHNQQNPFGFKGLVVKFEAQ